MKNLIFCLAASIPLILTSQNSLSGTVTDSETGDPVMFASVYFPQLEQGSETASDGSYSISDLPLGTYKLVVSLLGYQTYSGSVTISDGAQTLNIQLIASAVEMEEVIVSTPFHKLQRENVMKVEQIRTQELTKLGAVNLSEGITNIPGVTSVSTGMGIGKPVIRGLSANRVVVYTQGVRLENQQFGDEHGLGVDGGGIESIEVIKGPASLLYGSDALGGVLYLNPERFAASGEETADIGLWYHTNTEGFNTNIGYKTSGEQFKFLVRGGYNTHADYLDGSDIRVTNSRFRTADLKTGFAFRKGMFRTELRYNYNYSKLGIPEEIGEQTKTRTPVAPYQDLRTHILSSTSDLFLKKSNLKMILGYTFNSRQEFEEEEDVIPLPGEDDLPALDMDLTTFNYNFQYYLPKVNRLETILGLQGMFQKNENYGEEVLIPDAITRDIGVLLNSHLHFTGSDLQFGFRFDHRFVDWEASGSPSEEDYIAPLTREFNSVNAALGYRIDLTNRIIGRINLASGFRAPNLSELASNGIHEGTNRYEVGNPDLDNEKNIQLDLSAEYGNQHFELTLNGFYNSVNDYIYVIPTGEFIDGNPEYDYVQSDAELHGGEFGLHLHPHPLDWLHFESTLEIVRGRIRDGNDLPLIPAAQLQNTLRVELEGSERGLEQPYAFIRLRSISKQERVSEFETPTEGYDLLDLGFGGKFRISGQTVEFTVSGTNIFDKSYISHLSRLKVDGIRNMGRNLMIGLNLPI